MAVENQLEATRSTHARTLANLEAWNLSLEYIDRLVSGTLEVD